MNSDGRWVRIDDESASKYCFDTESEAWSLAVNKSGVTYMKSEQELENDPVEKRPTMPESYFSPNHKGFDFSNPLDSQDGFNFSAQNFTPSTADSGDGGNSNPFVFGTYNQHDSPGNYLLLII